MTETIDEKAAVEWCLDPLFGEDESISWTAERIENAARAALKWRQERDELRDQVRGGIIGITARVCSSPACSAAIIRRDDGHRYCSAGHPARWVQIDELDKAQARIAELEAERAVIMREWSIETDDSLTECVLRNIYGWKDRALLAESERDKAIARYEAFSAAIRERDLASKQKWEARHE
jgi:hypothetical protein